MDLKKGEQAADEEIFKLLWEEERRTEQELWESTKARFLRGELGVTGVWDTAPERVDQVVRVAAALARDLLAAGQQVGLLTNGVPPGDLARIALAPGAGRGQLALVLEALARVQPVVVKSLSALLDEYAPRVMGFGTVVVCVAAVLQPETRALLTARRRLGLPATLVHVSDVESEALPGVRIVRLDPGLAEGPA